MVNFHTGWKLHLIGVDNLVVGVAVKRKLRNRFLLLLVLPKEIQKNSKSCSVSSMEPVQVILNVGEGVLDALAFGRSMHTVKD